jgi:hypothetical protein
MANLLPLKLSNLALLQSLKYRYFGAKSTKSLEKVKILAHNMRIFEKVDPRLDLGWPWLYLINPRPKQNRKISNQKPFQSHQFSTPN